jgi:hypothetical protein
MGVWGTALFSDDTASDIRGDYVDYLGDGLTGPEATARVLSEYKSSLSDPDEYGVVWLALAAVQWKYGRLEPDVLKQALAVIDSGSDLRRWTADTPDHAKRKAVLEKLRAQITAPQPPSKPVRKRLRSECQWSIGQVVSYDMPSGRKVLFRVIDHHTDKGGTYPVFELLDWIGDDMPPLHQLESLGVRRSLEKHKHVITQVMVVGLGKRNSKRFNQLDRRSEQAQKQKHPSVVHVKYLDKFLQDWFLLE